MLSRPLLHIFVFDNVRGFYALGTPINWHFWYNDSLFIPHAHLLRASRVFSPVTLQFRSVWSCLFYASFTDEK